MDELAQEGVLFEQAISPFPMTSPAHLTILTSQYPHRHGVLANCYSLSDQSITLAEVLQANGWYTGAVVSSITLAVAGYHRGFDDYQDRFSGGQLAGGIVAASAVTWVEAHSKEPFFLWLHFYDPHWPYEAPEEFRQLYPSYEPSEDSRNYVAAYQGEISFVDYLLGRILTRLDELLIRDETLVVVTSDHGETLNEAVERRNIDHAFDHGPLLYDTELRVPLLFVCPSRLPKGVRVQASVPLLDIAPTILDFLGLEAPETFQGRSFAPLFKDPDHPWSGVIFSENGRHEVASKLFCIRTPEWKLIVPRPGERIRYPLKFPRGKQTHTPAVAGELYRLTEDPQELHNRFDDEPEVVQRLTNQLHAWQIGPGRTDFEVEEILEPEVAEKLEALGYIL